MKDYLRAIGGVILFVCSFCLTAYGQERGIYVTQSTLEDTKAISYLIERSKQTGINTFIIDYARPSKMYQQNIQLVKEAGINYVVRIAVFPGGADHDQMMSLPYREQKLALIKQAVALGANAIQLDYIRYSSKTTLPSDQNKVDVKGVIQWYKQQTASLNVPLQIDVFGITAFHEEKRIGQNPGYFANTVDAINPMVYPSHYDPYQVYSAQPYKTVYTSLEALKTQINPQNPVKIHAFIEAYNYRYPLTPDQRVRYISEEIRAADDANVAGWYVWSANNKYDYLFTALETMPSSKLATNN